MGARGHGVAIAQKMSIVRDQVVENQRSVERTTARRDHTPSFFVFADFLGHVMIHVCAIVQARVLLALAGGVYLSGSDLGQVAHKLAEPALLFKTWTKVTPHPTPCPSSVDRHRVRIPKGAA